MTPALELLERMVSIDSGPGHHDGIHQVQELIAERLVGAGFTVDRRATDGGPAVLLARRERGVFGQVLMLGHADTVFGEGAARDRPFAVGGDICTGPGVADMKGGLVVMLQALEQTQDLPHSVTVLVNGDEESGSIHSRQLIQSAASGHDVALVFEPARPSGDFVVARRGVQRYRVVVTGVAAHTGVDPSAGVNAIEEAAHHILRLQKLGRELEGASVTVALVSGGSRPNVVPAQAALTVDCRLDGAEAAAAIEAEMIRLTSRPPAVAGASTDVQPLDSRPPMLPAPKVPRLSDLYRRSAREAGFDTSPVSTGGSSDGNFTAALGIPTLDGLGPVGGGYHTDSEFLVTASLESRSRAAVSFLRLLAGEWR